MLLYHYYERSNGPLRNLSDLDEPEAKAVLLSIQREGRGFAARRADGYLERRRALEQTVRAMFAEKGGAPLRRAPHYFVAEACPWLETWYQDAASLAIDAEKIGINHISFTYGDMLPTFSPRVRDGREYRGQVYTFQEILSLIDKYGLPQHWNADGRFGPERYIEAQVWADFPQYYIERP